MQQSYSKRQIVVQEKHGWTHEKKKIAHQLTIHAHKIEITYDRRTELIKLSMGIKVVIVRLLAMESKNEVAAETGVE